MHEWQSLSHVRWECKYHVVIVPKYRRRVVYGRLKRRIGGILRELCRQQGMEDREIAYTLNCSVSLVRQYLAINDELHKGDA